jgi:hypothetical protein
MKKIILINGLIAGAICGGMLLTTQPLFESGALNPDSGMYVGYATMVIAFSLIFFGIKQYRDQQPTQSVSFGKAFRVGLFITIVSSLVYAVTWEVYYSQKGEEFMEFYTKCYIDNLKSDGATEAELLAGKEQMASMNEYYKNPLIRFTMTLFEIFPVGLIVSLISAAILKRKDFLPGSTTTTISA